MPLLETLLILLVASVLAGVAGSVLGVGGGVFLIPLVSLGILVLISTPIARVVVSIA